MTVPDEDLLDRFRAAGFCDLCGLYCDRREPHHAFTTGANGGPLDIPENVVGVGHHEDVHLRRRDNQMPCQCHLKAHSHQIPRRCVLAVIALRERREIWEIEELVHWLRMADKRTTMEQVEAKRLELQRRKAG